MLYLLTLPYLKSQIVNLSVSSSTDILCSHATSFKVFPISISLVKIGISNNDENISASFSNLLILKNVLVFKYVQLYFLCSIACPNSCSHVILFESGLRLL